MYHFVDGGDERYAAVLRERMSGQKVALEAKLAGATSDEERRRIEAEIAELLRKHRQDLREVGRLLF